MRKELIKANILIPLGCYELTQDQALLLKKKVEDKVIKGKDPKQANKRECQNKSLGVKRLQNPGRDQENSNVTAEMNQRCTEEKIESQ